MEKDLNRLVNLPKQNEEEEESQLREGLEEPKAELDEEALTKKQTEVNGELSDSEKNYDLLPKERRFRWKASGLAVERSVRSEEADDNDGGWWSATEVMARRAATNAKGEAARGTTEQMGWEMAELIPVTAWVQILCGLVIDKLFKRTFYSGNVLDIETSDSNAIFSVANSFVEVRHTSGSEFWIRIRDLYQSMEMAAGFVKASMGTGHSIILTLWRKIKNKLQFLNHILNKGELPCQKDISCTNSIYSSNFPPEVNTFEQWTLLKPEQKNMLSGWLKGAFSGGEKEMQESINQQLNFILSTAPIWDRLEVKGNKYVLGEFLEFKEKQEDTQVLSFIRKSKVSCLVIQKRLLHVSKFCTVLVIIEVKACQFPSGRK
ncbi:uncharacterized protein LOC123205097 [Mangifera indica]|uniref:uncharacterized protein LOC123205097 n=1 Tax=Mangifera indica TaxID=29780 RepID=UPI001CFB012B|nr:uncharacterized protein LOC123205097 [Mangifera indica]